MLIKGVYICCYFCMWEPLSGGLSDLLVFLKQLNMARKDITMLLKRDIVGVLISVGNGTA